jgi:excisionase family DNA binding protein
VVKRGQEENLVMRAYEVRKMLGIGKNTLYSWCELKIIPHKRVGRLILFSRKSIQEWIENNEKKGGIQ